MRKLKSCLFLFLFISVVFIASGFFVSKASASTIIDEDTTWTVDESPYTFSDTVIVLEGATLTIEPGVIVKFDNSSSLIILGSLRANGTAGNPIYFTSAKDDSHGDDSNYDEDDTTPKSGDWYGIVITPESSGENTDNSTNSSTINNVISRYSSGGINIWDKNVSSDGLDIDNQVVLYNSNSTFDKLSTSLVYLFEKSTASIDNSLISSTNGYMAVGVFDEGKLDITNSKVNACQDCRSAVQVSNASSVSLNNVEINIADKEEYSYGIMVFDKGSVLNMNGITEKGAWGGLLIDSDAGVIIDASTFECTDTCITNYGGSLLMTNSKISGASEFGILSYDSSYTVTNCSETPTEDGEVEETCEDTILDYPFEINNSEIFGNGIGITSYGGKITGENNSIHNNKTGAFNISEDEGGATVDLINNYWGDPSGPYNSTTNPSGFGNEVSDDISFLPFLPYDPLIPRKVPVIIVPGVMGTEMINGDEKLWLDIMHNLTDIGDEFMDVLQFKSDLTPLTEGVTVGDIVRRQTANVGIGNVLLFDYSDGLIQEFTNQGYIEGTDLFVFPYDWRYGVNDENVNKLKQKISDILSQTGADKVDIIAHSTGGLIVKKYVVGNPSENHINKAVFVGVPNTGAPQAIKTFLKGNNFGNPFLADNEIKKLAVNLPVVYDLSPSQQYFNNAGSFVETIDDYLFHTDKKDLDFNQTDNFLINDHKLNNKALENTNNLHTLDFDNYDLRTNGIDVYNIAGCKSNTTGKIIERREHGLLMTGVSYDAPEGVPGDGTVPLESATNLPVDQDHKFFALKADHGKMLSQNGIRQQIVNIISGANLSTENIITQEISQCKLNGRAIAVYSPIAIDVIDQDGNHSGLSSDGISIENNIPNASYEVMGDHKFVYLPDDEGQTYDISIKGTGDGVFTVTDSKIVDNQATSMQVFSEIPVTPSLTGTVNLGEITSLMINGNSKVITPTYVLDASHIQDFDPTHKDSKSNQNIISHSSGGSSIKNIISSNIATKEQPVENVSIAPIRTNKSQTKILSVLNNNQNLSKKENILPNSNLLTASAIGAINFKFITLALSLIGVFIILLVKNLLKR